MIIASHLKINFVKCFRYIRSPFTTRLELSYCSVAFCRANLVLVLATVSVTVLANDPGKNKKPLQAEETLAVNNGVLTHTKTDPIREMQARTNAQLALAHQQFMSQLSATDRERAMTERYEAGTNRIVGVASAESLYSVASINCAQARSLHAEAYSREMDNMLKQVEVAWRRREVFEVKRMEMDYLRQIRKSEYLNDQKWSNSREWERLKNHPELSNEKIAGGDALNFLLNKLAAGLLFYEFDARDPEYVETVPKWLSIDPGELKHINLRIENVSFVASDSGNGENIQWPQILGWNEFRPIREEFEKQRGGVRTLSQSTATIPPESIDGLFQILADLEQTLLENVGVKRKVSERRIFTEQHRCRLFIKRLRDEVKIVGATGRMQPHMRYDPSIDGANLISLLTFMSRNGARFERANIGAGSTYFGLYNKMRAWCLSLEESDVNYAPIFVGSAGDSK